MESKTLLYRGVNQNFSPKKNNINLSNSQDFSQNYGNIILVYSLKKDLHIKEENIQDRKEDVSKYDNNIENTPEIIGYKWKISKSGIYHYRVSSKYLTLEKIVYSGKNFKENISKLSFFNRKYLGLRQIDFSKKTGIPRVKLSEYENGVRTPPFEKILQLTSLLDIPQEIHFGEKTVEIK